MAHYHVAYSLSDVLLSLDNNNGNITGYIINDKATDFYGYQIGMSVYFWKQSQAHWTTDIVAYDRNAVIVSNTVLM